jgi:hypothetical protein
MSDSVEVGRFPVRDNWFVICIVSYQKGRGYFFSAKAVQDIGNGMISIRLGVFSKPPELLQEAKRLSRKTLERLADQMRDACKTESPTVMQHVAEAIERIPKEVANAG